MKLEDQVVSLDLAKKLKGLGVKQESYFYWIGDDLTYNDKWMVIPGEYFQCDCDLECHSGCDIEEIALAKEDAGPGEIEGGAAYSAFTVAELGEMLPAVAKLSNGQEHVLKCKKYGGDWIVGYSYDTMPLQFRDSCEADARAKMLIYLIEQGIVKP